MLKLFWGIIQNLSELLLKPIQTISSAQNRVISDVIAILLGENIDLGKLNKNVKQTNKTIESKIEEAQESLVNTSKVIKELNELIDNNQNELEKVRSEYEHITNLNKVSLQQAKPLLSELDKTIKKDNKKSYLISFLISLFFFIFGALFGPILYDFFSSLF